MSELTRPGVTESIEEIRANTMRMLQLLEAGKQTQGFATIWRDEVDIVSRSRPATNAEDDPGGVETA